MPMTLDGFRRLALSLPDVTEGAHMGHPDFRVRGKVFATLWPKDLLGMVKLTPEQQQAFVESEPAPSGVAASRSTAGPKRRAKTRKRSGG